MVLPTFPLKSFLFGTLALTSLCIGLIGVILPGLPSTEFILLAVWFADRSSPMMHSWLLEKPYIGTMMRNWKVGKMPRKAKVLTSITMTVSAYLIFELIKHLPSAIFVVSIMAIVLIWLWRLQE